MWVVNFGEQEGQKVVQRGRKQFELKVEPLALKL